MTRSLPPGVYGFADVVPGDHYTTGSRLVTARLIDRFADLTGDRFEIHMVETAARRHGFDARVAHGLLILALVDGLKNTATVQWRAQASLGWDWSFRAPVLLGASISARITVDEKTAISDPARGILTLGFEVTGADGTVLQRGQNRLMVYA